MFSIKGRRVFYTGGAGGLGKDTTLRMLAAGAQVIVLDNDDAKIERLKQAVVHEDKARLQVLKADLLDQEALQAHLAELSRDRPIDVLINNAAIYPSKPFEEYTLDELSRVHAVNVEAAVLCVRGVLPGMRDQGWGRIITVSSITFNGAWENLAPYVQSKGALIGLTRVWAREFGKWGITANAIAPGAFPTDAEKIHSDPAAYERFVLDNQAVKRRGTPDDIAAAVMFFAAEESGFITGQTLNVDGGWVMK